MKHSRSSSETEVIHLFIQGEPKVTERLLTLQTIKQSHSHLAAWRQRPGRTVGLPRAAASRYCIMAYKWSTEVMRWRYGITECVRRQRKVQSDGTGRFTALV